MKELSIEEKAKRYDEVLAMAKECLKDGTITSTATGYIETIFPELKKSEDERIRKAIIDFLWKEKIFLQEAHSSVENNPKYRFVMDAIAWLEKQGADKVEPKFKVGDFLVNDYCMGKIVELTNDAYLLDTGQGIPFSCEHNARLWDIAKDAKDGDVLATEDWVFIFKKINSKREPTCYCHYDIELGFFIDTKSYIATGSEIYPATKEQRDTLMKAMADAGYTFDFKKNELKKVEPTDKYKGLTDFERTLADICIGWIGEELGWRQYIKDNADVLLKIAAKKFNSVQDAPF